jgi:hypothetical protein
MCNFFFFTTLAYLPEPGAVYPGYYSALAPADYTLAGRLEQRWKPIQLWGKAPRGPKGGTIHFLWSSETYHVSGGDDLMQAGLCLVYVLSSGSSVLLLCHDWFETHWRGRGNLPERDQIPFWLLSLMNCPGRDSWDTEQKMYVLLKTRIFAQVGSSRGSECSLSLYKGRIPSPSKAESHGEWFSL